MLYTCISIYGHDQKNPLGKPYHKYFRGASLPYMAGKLKFLQNRTLLPFQPKMNKKYALKMNIHPYVGPSLLENTLTSQRKQLMRLLCRLCRHHIRLRSH